MINAIPSKFQESGAYRYRVLSAVW